jgi:hypothetical protein
MPTVHIRAMRRARDILGSDHALAQRLGVNDHSVKIWILGSAQTPPDVFLKAVDIIIEYGLTHPSRAQSQPSANDEKP